MIVKTAWNHNSRQGGLRVPVVGMHTLKGSTQLHGSREDVHFLLNGQLRLAIQSFEANGW